jgi:sulfoxide reductase heme-binding subunit YedZ
MASNPSVLWYVTRGAGLVSLLLLTAVVVLGVLLSSRWASPTWPRFLSQFLHRSLSLTAVVFLLLHILTSSYRTLWLGLGVVASELIAALVISSLLRARLGFRAWRVVHWLAYASWPIAIVHGLGTGTDARVGWALLLDAGCVGAVLVAVAMRLSGGPPRWLGLRALAGLITVASSLALAVWAVTGPLQPGWARAAGTPTGLLATTGSAASSTSPSPSAAPVGPTSGAQGAVPTGLSVRVRGSAVQNADGSSTLTLTDEGTRNLQVVLGLPAAGGSTLQLSMTQGGAALCSTAATFDGRVVTAICGPTQITLALRSSDDGGIRGTMTTVAATR